jgi:hypothetical protein
VVDFPMHPGCSRSGESLRHDCEVRLPHIIDSNIDNPLPSQELVPNIHYGARSGAPPQTGGPECESIQVSPLIRVADDDVDTCLVGLPGKLYSINYLPSFDLPKPNFNPF